MQEGDEAWRFYERDGFADAIVGALTEYAQAYDLHPRNREAVAGAESRGGRCATRRGR